MTKQDSIVVRPTQLKTALIACFQHDEPAPVLVKGGPGIGKTDIIVSAATHCGMDTILSHPAVEDPTDSKGIPWMDAATGRMRYMPVGQIAKALEVKKPTAWFIDDLGQAPESVQKAYMQWLLAREVDGNRLPDDIKIVAATNRRSDRAGVSGLLEPVKSRFCTILELEPNVQDWSDWALDHDVHPAVLAYIRDVQSDALYKFEPTADISNSPCPRTWAHVSRIMKMEVSDNDVLFAMLVGAVGEAAATSYKGFLDIVEKAPSVEEVLADPKRCRIPEDLSALFALSASLAVRAAEEPKTFGKIAAYTIRLHENGKGDFCAFLLRDALRKQRSLKDTPEFGQLAKHAMAKDVFEAIAASAK